MGKVVSINISPERGTDKQSIPAVNVIENYGLEGDGHGGNWDKQVSIFPVEALAKVPEHKKDEVFNGGYTENFTISGIPLEELTVGKTVRLGAAEIKVLYIGKDEFKEHGRPYIVSREGRFGIVVKGGKVACGDEVEIL